MGSRASQCKNLLLSAGAAKYQRKVRLHGEAPCGYIACGSQMPVEGRLQGPIAPGKNLAGGRYTHEKIGKNRK